ncbi:hypothetical protein KIH86_22735 [Paenibacillus sp. HN-1]|uniref:hypothetical protein n=1 Tax=Paenibacillus TaxID=44249 RepID=UPI001CA7C972|nr:MULTISPECIES: hypothetical protein [Paenibacillus]MBY9079287.1 hypothetical protein [Paenibacillus sp. CGMCC 1.18879]MBY9087010.1 hypothetical protein [Paenibacillus sinensis]
MSVSIKEAVMRRDEEGSYVGKTVFELEGHKAGYEINFFSKKGKDWDYSLSFADEPGSEEQFLELDARLEEDDELFDLLLDAALDAEEA